MQTDMPELTCQWCGGTIPENDPRCSTCNAARPRDDLVVHAISDEHDEEPLKFEPETASDDVEPDEEERARQILKDMDAYIPPEDTPAPVVTRPPDPAGDALVVIGVLAIGAVIGGLAGWFLAPPLLHDFFHDVVGVDSEGPEAFRRLGAFVGALVAMLFGALLTTIVRR